MSSSRARGTTALTLAISPAAPGAVRLVGVLGEALAANHRGRLSTFVVDETSPAVTLFSPAQACANHAGDWYGEHAGKWLHAAARAAVRTGDERLQDAVRRVADRLVSFQDDNGYLGTYAPERRFTRRQPPRPSTLPPAWDGAPPLRTWDVWTHAYLMLGLLEAYRLADPRAPGRDAWLAAAQRIGDLCWRTLSSGGIDITELGNHHGLSATVLMDPALELHFATGEPRYLELALLVLEQANRNPRLALLKQALGGADASEIGTGKAYQLLWNLVALAKLHRATGDSQYLRAVENLWRNVREHHLTLGGGPWGGVGQRSREIFNPASVFSPYGYVETCSTLAWMQLNAQLLAITGEARYAQEVERSAYNDLLGAQAPNGEDWCYYSFPNGRRVHTTSWRCCKSSGAMALEELALVAHGYVGGEAAGSGRASASGDASGIARARCLAVNVLGPSEASLALPQAGTVHLEQTTGYPFEGEVTIRVRPERAASFEIRVRIPDWAEGARVHVNGVALASAVRPGEYVSIEREWHSNDAVALELPMRARVHRQANRSVQESVAPDGSPVSQEVLRFDYLALTRGPLVYATGLIDGYKIEETLRVPEDVEASGIEVVPRPSAPRAPPAPASLHDAGPQLRLRPMGRAPIDFVPYFAAGDRRDGSWRLTWMQLVPPMDAAPMDAAGV